MSNSDTPTFETGASSNNTKDAERMSGRVKWFNNKAGYGFVTVSEGSDGDDVFVHHSALQVGQEQYKYLVQGEYVEFTRTASEGDHAWQASDVRGVNGGKLMCETRNETRTETRRNRVSHLDNSQKERTASPQSRRPVRRGAGPRTVRDEDGVEWELVRKRTTRPPTRGGPRQHRSNGAETSS
jgi:CspA family cold shock protein